MRHRKKGKKLGRKKAPRVALLRGLAVSLIIHGKIKTTAAKAKAVRSVVEKLITTGKKGNLTARRQLAAYLGSNDAVKKVMEVLGPKYSQQKGACTRIIKLGPRSGDGAEMVVIEFI